MTCTEGRGPSHQVGGSSNLEIFGRRLAAVADDFILDLLAFIERGKSSLLYSRDMDEDVPAADTLGLDEAVPLRWVEPFYCTLCHHGLLRKCTQRANKTHEHCAFTNPNQRRCVGEPMGDVQQANNARIEPTEFYAPPAPDSMTIDHGRPMARTF
jgi:hypothetical protein